MVHTYIHSMRVSFGISQLVAVLMAVASMITAPAMAAAEDHSCCPASFMLQAGDQSAANHEAHLGHQNDMHMDMEMPNSDMPTMVDCDPADCTTATAVQMLPTSVQQADLPKLDQNSFMLSGTTASSVQHKQATPPPRTQ